MEPPRQVGLATKSGELLLEKSETKALVVSLPMTCRGKRERRVVMDMETILRPIITGTIKLTIKGGIALFKGARDAQRTPEEREASRRNELNKIHSEALKLAENSGIEDGKERAEAARVIEVGLLNDRGLLEGVDIRGLDLRNQLILRQKQINLAVGDDTTLLPHYIQRPPHWKRRSLNK